MTENHKGRYMQLLLRDFHALEALIKEKRLECGVRRFGYELELNFLDQNLEPASIGPQVRDQLKDKRFTTEFALFNLELNSSPVLLEGRCFSTLATDLQEALTRVREQAGKSNCQILLTGIVPTLGYSHITPEALTPEPRYQALHALRRSLKGGEYEYHIEGIDELLTRNNIALFAGCGTSFQTHFQIDAEDVVDSYNWAQLLAAPLLACATNSPLFLGYRLWHETRVALFEQATDTRNPTTNLLRNQPRVFFGEQWLQESALELLQEDITNFDALLTLEDVEDPWAAIESGRAPDLHAWNIFNGSIYRWNRLCYGMVQGKPSLRIENRILPSGPTVADMVANSVFWAGAMAGLPQSCRNLQERLAFADVKQNFFKAARLGLDVRLRWIDGRTVDVRELILEELLPIAQSGLQKAGIAKQDADHYLNIIRARTESGRTGSQWMLDNYCTLLKTAKRGEALHVLTSGMIKRQDSAMPVHTWEPIHAEEQGDSYSRYNQVHMFMTTSLYKVGVDDVMDLAAHIMEWKKIGHIPVEDDKGLLVGVITRDSIINFIVNAKNRSATVTVGDLMVRNPVTIPPDTTLEEAVQLLLSNEISCLPVTTDGRIVGIVTDRDFVEVARQFLNEHKRNQL